jgi:hypothetical protein
MHTYEVRPRKDKRGVDLISDALPFGRLWDGGPNANALNFSRFFMLDHSLALRKESDRGLPRVRIVHKEKTNHRVFI